jgi:hypothetical protein
MAAFGDFCPKSIRQISILGTYQFSRNLKNKGTNKEFYR